YRDPIEFFARTYLTEGMRRLLTASVERLADRGREPVVQLKTAFGGGKTHTMLALFHLLGGDTAVERLAGAGDILRASGLGQLPEAKIAVVVGTAINPSRAREVGGIPVHTLWGDIAAQLGGGEAYTLVEDADRRGVAPGADDLAALMNRYGPAVILMDELVAYMRNIYGVQGLPAGSFDANLTFVQSLTEAVKRSRRSQLVASIPESGIEIGGEAGAAALARLENTFGRLESIWKPVGAMEGFEIVRRRLFTTVQDEVSRNKACEAFRRFYDANPADFPQECREGAYRDRLRAAYPIHPELFDRLYEDWSSLERFQRTRGVLRLMAAVIHELWVRDDRSLLILPGSLPLDAPRVRDELLRYLPEGWNAIVDRDIDGERSGPRALDVGSPRFGAVSAARRVARTIFLGSAPSVRQQTVRGIEDVRVRLGVAQPGESVAVFNDALARLTDRLTHLYSGNRRYWYDTQPNLRRTMEDRAGKWDPAEVEAEIVRRLRLIRDRGDFRGVHVCPASGDVPDEPQARLVVLSLSAGHRASRRDSAALTAANEILDRRGGGPRAHRNMLLFAAPDADQVAALEEETRRYLAWKSIAEEADMLNLDAYQRREATQGMERSDQTVGLRLNDAYCWLLVPTQEGTDPMQWEAARLPGGQENPVAKAARKVRNSGQLITQWSPDLLKMDLDRWLWPDAPHIGLKRVWECLTTYLYLPRLRDEEALLATIREGINSRAFGYAGSVGEDGHYRGLQFGGGAGSIYLDDRSVLVKPDVAASLLDAQTAGAARTPYPPTGQDREPVKVANGGAGATPALFPSETPGAAQPKRFHGSVQLDPMRVQRDVGQIAEEVIQHLTSLMGSDVKITLEIHATLPEGVPDHLVRTVTENCRTLKFTTQSFEEE
ncbi:MAG: ATP-binding protein, partial [Armatimonadetes bacterium]|nr:ATP-binding protein [Armatimonadota bacterium]